MISVGDIKHARPQKKKKKILLSCLEALYQFLKKMCLYRYFKRSLPTGDEKDIGDMTMSKQMKEFETPACCQLPRKEQQHRRQIRSLTFWYDHLSKNTYSYVNDGLLRCEQALWM